MKGLTAVIALIAIAALFLFCVQIGQKASIAHDTHTGVLKGSTYDCELDDLTVRCRGLVP